VTAFFSWLAFFSIGITIGVTRAVSLGVYIHGCGFVTANGRDGRTDEQEGNVYEPSRNDE
jgi:hypothetical protein